MKMTKQEVADLLLKANNDLSNVVLVTSQIHEYSVMTLENMMRDIANGFVFEIKDNRVKEITLDLFDKVVVRKGSEKAKGKISYVETNTDYFTPYVVIGSKKYTLEELNKNWQLVED